jgi:GrpB-like predicted nucleotidyltransferase (UPF0157 family)
MNSLIIQDYDPSSPQRFETSRARMAAALDGMVSVIEHVGSTAVPGLAAKPIIDIDVALADVNAIASYSQPIPQRMLRLGQFSAEANCVREKS